MDERLAVMPHIFTVNDRRQLEAEALKPVFEDPTPQRCKRILLDSLQVPEFRAAFKDLGISTLMGKPFDYHGSRHEDAVLEIRAANSVNGEWSLYVERLNNPKFDRLNFVLSDLGNAERFAQEHAGAVRYDHTRGRWILWTGTHWQEDLTGEVFELMAHTLRQIYSDAEILPTKAEREAAVKWGLQCESRARITDALALAQSLPKIRSLSTDFDCNASLLNVQNGMLDLRSGTFLPHDHRALCQKIAGASWQSGAGCAWWEEFLSTIFGNDMELIAFVQRAVGYSLTGSTDAQALFFAYGSGANGKSTFFEILRLLFGDYYQKAPSELLLLKRSESVPLDVARLRGVRLAVLAEIEAGKHLNESRAKDLSGGDTITARHLYGEFFSFRPTVKIWMYGNHKPEVTGTDYGLWRRMHLIPFTVTIPEEKRKPQQELLTNAQHELSGILSWAIEGLAAWKITGLAVPSAVSNATKGYQEESDTLARFLEECTTNAGEVGTSELFQAFKEWSGSPLSQKAFFRAMQEKGFQLRLGTKRKRFWKDLGLTTDRE